MSRKIKPSVFLKAAKQIELSIKEGYGIGCCEALSRVLNIPLHWDDFRFTPEFILFKKMFCGKRGMDNFWFGACNKIISIDTTEYKWVPHPINQQKRIKALNKAYKAARKLK